MKEYQVYFLTEDNHIMRREDLFCEDDDDAKRFAKQMVDGLAVELWQAARKIAQFVPEK
jgi:hypothetical protein